MKKTFLLKVLALIFALCSATCIFTACKDDGGSSEVNGECAHDWKEATCLSAKTCKYCGEIKGDANWHDFKNNGVCRDCGRIKTDESLFEYVELEDGTYGIRRINNNTLYGDVTLPDEYNGKRVTEVLGGAFSLCGFTSIQIPPTVKAIRKYAFDRTRVSTIEIADGVEKIEQLTSFENEYIKSLRLPANLTELEGAICRLSGLESIDLPVRLASISEWDLQYCYKLKEINVPKGNKHFISKDDVLYSKDEKTLVRYPYGKEDESFTLPNSVEAIENYAFCNNQQLQEVKIRAGSHLKVIKKGAFNRCYNLKEITFHNDLEEIQERVFADCVNLEEIIIPKSVKNMGANVFYNCSVLVIYCEAESKPQNWDENWNVDNCNVIWNCKKNDQADDGRFYVTEDGLRYAIKDGFASVCEQITEVEEVHIASSIRYKGENYAVTAIEKDVFRYDDTLTSVTIPATVKMIGEQAFEDCSKLTSVNFEEGCEDMTIGARAFSDCKALTTITLPEGVTTICEEAFAYCNYLKYISIPNSLTAIENKAFYLCHNINYNLHAGLRYLGNENNKFMCLMKVYSTATTAANIHTSCRFIMPDVFESNSWEVKSATIPESVVYIGEAAFSFASSLESIEVAEGNPYYSSSDGILFNKDKSEIICYPRGKTDTRYVIPKGVTRIGKKAFYYNQNLDRITISGDVRVIDDDAFNNCNNLSNVTMKEGVTYIGNRAFDNCSRITTLNLPLSLTYIGDEAFATCYNVKKIVISKNVTYVGAGAFDDCRVLFIYCEAESKPQSWNNSWNTKGCPVYWYRENQPTESGLYWHYVDGEVVSW